MIIRDQGLPKGRLFNNWMVRKETSQIKGTIYYHKSGIANHTFQNKERLTEGIRFKNWVGRKETQQNHIFQRLQWLPAYCLTITWLEKKLRRIRVYFVFIKVVWPIISFKENKYCQREDCLTISWSQKNAVAVYIHFRNRFLKQ